MYNIPIINPFIATPTTTICQVPAALMVTRDAHQLATAVGVIKFAIIFKTAAPILTKLAVSHILIKYLTDHAVTQHNLRDSRYILASMRVHNHWAKRSNGYSI